MLVDQNIDSCFEETLSNRNNAEEKEKKEFMFFMTCQKFSHE
jgi:hypothetical protein